MKTFVLFILKFLKPFIVLMGKMYLPFTRKKVTGKDYYKIRDNILLGDTLLANTYGEISNLINPEKFKHAALYVGKIYDDDICYVMEAKKEGVVLTDLVSFLLTKDVVLCCRPLFLEDSDLSRIRHYVFPLLGKPYDYYFEDSDKAFYCFEAVAKVYKDVRPVTQFFKREIIKGIKTYSYLSFYKNKNFEQIFDTRIL